MSTQIKFELEFPIQASPQMLFQYFATPSGLSEWFADNVNLRGELYTFIWDGVEEKAKVLQEKTNKKIKFTWLEEEDEKIYFEFRIQVDEITKDVSLIITDFAEEGEIDESKMFWENQIDELKHTIGA
ncbi:START-like domain-containing protein [Lutibacter sp.]|uniref:START-like domain-containing protein n=1 Tax=Lutibacter sp. TaxID=1925666 RepID=UPI0025C56084|nr:START-like domain-containing protein [Lutibacter sp.]MCF6181862.1 START-like domain-containing protein [Lutibacter sp.]